MTAAKSAVQSASSKPSPKRGLARWRFWLPMALQLALILPIPLRNTYTAIAGETIVLKTVPVDPYNWLQGYYQILSYETISDIEELVKLNGGEFLEGSDRQSFYLVFAQVTANDSEKATAQQTQDAQSDGDWQPIRISPTVPQVAENELFIKGESEGRSVRYNLERYYMPESLRNELNATIDELRRQDPQAVKVEVKVDQFGGAVAVALLMDGKRFEF